MGVFDIILSALAALLRCCVPEEEKPQPPQVVVPPVPSVAYDNDTRFDPALLSVDAERLRQSAFAAGDEAAQKGRESHTRYESGDKHSAHELSLQAAECRATAAKAHAASADAVFAQKNAPRGLWEIDLHLLLVHEAEERVLRRLQSCAADPSAGRRELCIVYGQGHHSVGGVAKLKPAVLQMLHTSALSAATRDGVPNEGCCTVHVPFSPQAKL